MILDDLPTPCLVLDRSILQANLDIMSRAVGRHGVALRPHMKTAKSIDVARLAMASKDAAVGGITVSTIAEAEYFAAHGIADILYAVGITPQKLDQIAKLNAAGAAIMVVTDDLDVASAIAGHATKVQTLIEIDCGEARGGIGPDDPGVRAIAERLGSRFAGVMTHAGHSYAGRSVADMRALAELERQAALRSAAHLRAAGFAVQIISVGSTPTALHAATLDGVSETRPGVYMFGDLFQAQIGTNALDAIAVTVLASVIGQRKAERRVLIDAGALALSKDRSTQAAPIDYGFGLVLDINANPTLGHSIISRANQEHGIVDLDPTVELPAMPIGTKLRVAPNHTCLTSAAHDRYYVVDGSDTVQAIWPRVNGW